MLRPINPVKHRPVWNKFKELAALGLGVGVIAFSIVVGIFLAVQLNGGMIALTRYIKELFK